MTRVKGGIVTRKHRKRVLKLAKGYYGSKHALYKTANEQVMRSLQYAYRDRKTKKREFRKLWIQRINAAAKLNGLKYSQFINGLTKAGIEINRKMLADLAVNDAAAFAQICEAAKKGLEVKTSVKAEKVVTFKLESKAAKAARLAEAAKPAKATKKVEEVKVEEPVVEEKPVEKKTTAKKTTTKKAAAEATEEKPAAKKTTAKKTTTKKAADEATEEKPAAKKTTAKKTTTKKAAAEATEEKPAAKKTTTKKTTKASE